MISHPFGESFAQEQGQFRTRFISCHWTWNDCAKERLLASPDGGTGLTFSLNDIIYKGNRAVLLKMSLHILLLRVKGVRRVWTSHFVWWGIQTISSP